MVISMVRMAEHDVVPLLLSCHGDHHGEGGRLCSPSCHGDHHGEGGRAVGGASVHSVTMERQSGGASAQFSTLNESSAHLIGLIWEE